jgi:MYXO-CTERM domain-containing protein
VRLPRLAAIFIFTAAQGRAWAGPFWTQTGSMGEARSGNAAVLLPSGKVLVAGGAHFQPGNPSDEGYTSIPTATAELYDPVAGTWSYTGTMSEPRWGPTATLLLSGKVLVTDGSGDATAELYDPTTGVWSPTGSMSEARLGHSTTLLPSGKVLVAGGMSDQQPALSSAELYDPAMGEWSPTGSMLNPRAGGDAATLLPSGEVLVSGGFTGNNSTVAFAAAELYDPSTGTWRATGFMTTPRVVGEGFVLPTGKVLVVGGAIFASDSNTYFTSAELYDPVSETWTATASMNHARDGAFAVLLATGDVLFAGGGNYQQDSNSESGQTFVFVPTAELYSSALEAWRDTADMAMGLSGSASLLQSGKVLVAGGTGTNQPALSSAELYDPLATGGCTTTAGSAFPILALVLLPLRRRRHR